MDARRDGPQAFGGHVRQGPPRSGWSLIEGAVLGQVEVEEHRGAVGVRRMFDGFTSPWATPRPKAWSSASASRAMIQATARASVSRRQELARRVARLAAGYSGRRPRRGPRGDRRPSRGAGRLRRRSARTAASVAPPRNGMQISWNAPSSTMACDRDLHDVGVPGPGQQPGLGRRPGRDLHDDLTVVEVGLLGQEDPGEAPSPQLPAQQIRADLVAGLRERPSPRSAPSSQLCDARSEQARWRREEPLKRRRDARGSGRERPAGSGCRPASSARQNSR